MTQCYGCKSIWTSITAITVILWYSKMVNLNQQQWQLVGWVNYFLTLQYFVLESRKCAITKILATSTSHNNWQMFQVPTERPKGIIRVYTWEGEDCYVAGGGPEEVHIVPNQCQLVGTTRLKAHCEDNQAINGQAIIQIYKSQDCSDEPTPHRVPPQKVCANKDFFGLSKSYAYECL